MTDVIESGGWVRAENVGLPLGIHDLTYLNNIGLVVTDTPSGISERKYQCSINIDGVHWIPKKLLDPVQNIRLLKTDKDLIMVGVLDNQMVVYKSITGIFWEKSYTSDIQVTSSNKCRTRVLFGTSFVLLRGLFFHSSDLSVWRFTKFSEEYSSYDVLDITYYQGVYYYLLSNGDRCIIASGKNENQISYYKFNSNFIPASISSNDEYLIILGGYEDNFYLSYSKTGLSGDWSEIKFKPKNSHEHGESSLSDAIYYKDNWEIVGYHSHWNSIRTSLISYRGLVYTISKDFSSISEHFLQVPDLKRIYLHNDKLYALGDGLPNGNAYLLIKE